MKPIFVIHVLALIAAIHNGTALAQAVRSDASSANAQSAMVAAAQQGLSDGAARCDALLHGGAEVARKFANLLDAPTTIVSARLVSAGGNGDIVEKDYPEHCRVEGQIAPTVGFLLRMPTRVWNGKFLMGGCGGPCGLYLTDRSDPALVRGYAVVVTDMGHKGSGWMFADNNLAQMVDFGYRATHVTAIAAKAVIAEFYGDRPKRNYFVGCSTGGRQGLVEAQRFPMDFDGIVAGAPPWMQTGHQPYASYWPTLANMKDGKPILDVSKLPLIHEAVLAACDANDGLKDGIIQNPAACNWQPSAMVCHSGADSMSCLTSDEAEVVRKIYQGPVDSTGQRLYRGQARGSEMTWTNYVGQNGKPGPFWSLTDTTLHHLAFLPAPGPGYSIQQFDFDRDPPRLATNDVLFAHANPDLTKFRDHGSKLIIFHGWNDNNNIPPELAIDYYRLVQATMGGPDTAAQTARLFMLPGAYHCRYGEGGGEVDWLTALENWVEHGAAPEQVLAYHMKHEPYDSVPIAGSESRNTLIPRHPLNPDSYDRVRPVFAYPGVARYKSGDPALPSSWVRAQGLKNAHK